MFPSKIDSMYVKRTFKRICQGDILRNIDVIDSYAKASPGEIEIDELNLPYAIVMSQDCDLEWDFKNREEAATVKHDKYLRTILICPAYIAEDFKVGKHLESIGLKMENWSTDKYKLIKQQNNARFHFLEKDQALQVPDLVVDFKHYYAIPRDTLFKMYGAEHYLVTINQLFRECLSQRFSNYLSRIGLPTFKERTTSEGTLTTAPT